MARSAHYKAETAEAPAPAPLGPAISPLPRSEEWTNVADPERDRRRKTDDNRRAPKGD